MSMLSRYKERNVAKLNKQVKCLMAKASSQAITFETMRVKNIEIVQRRIGGALSSFTKESANYKQAKIIHDKIIDGANLSLEELGELLKEMGHTLELNQKSEK